MLHRIKHHLNHHLHKHTISFVHAFEGIYWAFTTQPNYRIHITLSIFAIIAGSLLHIKLYEWLVIILLITLGLVIETINSAFEQALDCVSHEVRSDIKIAKDAAAGAMLLFAIGSVVMAVVIFLPYFQYR